MMPSVWLFRTIAVVGVMTLAMPSDLHAQSSKASAEALFGEGRRLMAEGKLEEACPKFADSQKLDPSSGTLINLGSCYEKLGRTASAWAAYQEAGSIAVSSGRTDHVGVAQKRASALEPLLAHVKVLVPQPVDGMEIKRDGVPVTKAEWGLAIPIDPGEHTYVVEAPKHAPWTFKIVVPKAEEGGKPASVNVTVPELEKLPDVVVPPPPPGATVGAPVEAPRRDGWRPQRTAALVAGGIGIIGFGFSTAFALQANSTFKTSLLSCPRDKNLCTPTGVRQRDDAIKQATLSTVTFGVGLAGVALGTVLWFTAPAADSRTALQVSPTLGGVMMRGRW